MKIILIVLMLLVVGMVGVAIVAGPQIRGTISGMAPKQSGIEVRVEPASIGRLVETVTAPGRIEPHTSVQISAEVSARIIELPFREGAEVRRGDVVCRLNDKDLQAAMRSSEARRDGEQFRLKSDSARLAGLQANLEFARRELERVRSLYESGDNSMRELDQAMERVQDLETSVQATQYSISVSESSLAAAEADIERAQQGLEDTVMVAPMDGVITLLLVEVGEAVTGAQNYPGTVMMHIADLSRMVMKAEVAESDIASVGLGQNAQIHINAYQDEVFTGTVRQIALQREQSLTSGTGFFRAEIEIDLQGRQILSGLMANVDIEIETHEGLVVPYQAIVVREVEAMPDDVKNNPLVDQTKSKTSVVYCMEDGKAKCTPVKPGPSDLTHRIVLDGLEEGSQVIIGPYKVLEAIAHDEEVRIEGADADAEDPENPADTDAESTDAESDEPETSEEATSPDPDAPAPAEEEVPVEPVETPAS